MYYILQAQQKYIERHTSRLTNTKQMKQSAYCGRQEQTLSWTVSISINNSDCKI